VKISAWLAAVVAALSLAACASPQVGQSSDLTMQSELPPPTRADLVAADRPYFVGPFDKLKIDVFGVEQLQNKEYQVDASGRLSFPFAGTIEAGGRTPQEISDELAGRLRGNIIRDPQVTVNLMETISQLVTVEGAVNRPGRYPAIGEQSLLETIAVAEGTTDVARLENVLIFREVQGQRYVGAYNLKAIRLGNYPDPQVYANDVVVVGDSAAKKIFRDLSPLLVSPVVVLLQSL
jgi:polysaccharide export outer membrane protein